MCKGGDEGSTVPSPPTMTPAKAQDTKSAFAIQQVPRHDKPSSQGMNHHGNVVVLPWPWLQGLLRGAGELMTGTSAVVGTKAGDHLSHPRATLTKQMDKSQQMRTFIYTFHLTSFHPI